MRGERLRLIAPMVVAYTVLFAVAFFLFRPIISFLVYQQVDYADHLSYLQPTMDWAAVGQVLGMFPHFLYHLSVYGVFKAFSVDTIANAGIAVSIAAYIFGTLATFWLITRILGKPRTYLRALVYGLLTLALMLLMPIDIFTPDNLFVGYIGVNAYHNPTIVLLKPFAIILFWCVTYIFQKPMQRPLLSGEGNESKSEANPAISKNMRSRRIVPVWVMVLVSVLCIFAKPSYMIALLPALVLVIAYRVVRRQAVDWVLLIWGVIIPSYLALAFQIVAFRNSTGFIFAPLAVIYSWTRINPDAPNGMVWKFLLSILFPLLVYLFYFKAAVKNLYLNLAWIVFAFGAAYMYLLAEGGERLAHANFTWCAICTLFILFIVSVVFVI